MPLADLVPSDPSPFVKWAPNANTRRIYDRNVYVNDTAFTIAPVIKMVGLPARVDSDEVTIFPKAFNATLLDPSGTDPNLAGIWYADILVSSDPDISPNFIYVTVSHPDWAGEETRIVPFGTGKLNWTQLAVADPPDAQQIVFIAHPGSSAQTAPVLSRGTVTETTGNPDVQVVPQTQPGHYALNFVLKTGPQGSPGNSAYQVAQSQGYQGTVQQWLTSLQGQPGSNAVQPQFRVGTVTDSATPAVTLTQPEAHVFEFDFSLPSNGMPSTAEDTLVGRVAGEADARGLTRDEVLELLLLSNSDIGNKIILPNNSGLIKTAVPGGIELKLNTPGPIPTNYPARILVLETNGVYPAQGAYPKEFCGYSEPNGVALNITPVDLWTRLGGPATPSSAVLIEPPVSGFSTSTWTFPMPAGLTDGQTVVLTMLMHTTVNAAFTYSMTVGGQTVPERFAQTASGYQFRGYTFQATPAMAGSNAVFSATLNAGQTGTHASVRCVVAGVAFTGLASEVPQLTPAKSGVAGTAGTAGGNTKTTPTQTTNGYGVEISIVAGHSGTATAIANWAPPAGITRLADVYHTPSTAYMSIAIGAALVPVKDALVGGRVWTSTDGAGANTGSYGGTVTMVMQPSLGAPAQLVRDSGGVWTVIS